MNFADFYATFASTPEYRPSFEEYKRADLLVGFLVAVFAGANVGVNTGVIVGYCEEVFED